MATLLNSPFKNFITIISTLQCENFQESQPKLMFYDEPWILDSKKNPHWISTWSKSSNSLKAIRELNKFTVIKKLHKHVHELICVFFWINDI